MTLMMLSQLLNKTKEQLRPVIANVERILSPVTNFTRSNPLSSGVILGVPAGVTASSIVRSITRKKKKKTTRKRKKTTRKSRKRKKPVRRAKKKRKYKYPRTAGKRKDRSTKRIRMTKHGQPYIILKSGKARFIKKSSARRSRKMKGGRY